MKSFGDDAIVIPARPELLARLRALPGVRDVVVCEEAGIVVFGEGADRSTVSALLEAPASNAVGMPTTAHVVRVVYDGEDLLTLPRDAVALHTGAEYTVSMLGFLPGFAYLRGLPEALKVPRRAPRPRVPAASVAIAAEYTGIYPVASAGGWHLLGRALEIPRFAPGDHVRFVAVTPEEAHSLPAFAAPTWELPAPTGPFATVTRVAGLALFVDGGRAGQMHVGMPPGGPLVRTAFDAANARVGNPAGACAIEVTGQLEVEVDGVRVAVASGAGRVAYLAAGGGFDAPVVSGSRGVLLAAGIGRPLKRGDVIGIGAGQLAVGNVSASSGSMADEHTAGAPIVLRPGPDATPEILREVISAEYRISPTSDRAGTRLVGPPLGGVDAGRRASMPMVEGAIELTPSGLVVLGPDHPTTGGYPVVAVIARASRDAFFGRPLGAPVRFAL